MSNNNEVKVVARETKSLSMKVRKNDSSKKAGSNYVTVGIKSSDWRVSLQDVTMTIREAQTLRNFLNEHLD